MGWNWERFLHPPVWQEQCGRKAFVNFALLGIVLMIFALSGLYLDGLRERLGGFFAGMAMTAGASGTLALAYGEWQEEGRFTLKVIVRVGFLFIAPCFVLIDLPGLLEKVGVWGCVGLCAITVIPFGLSLVRLIWKKRNA